jgi:hypothetical protein
VPTETLIEAFTDNHLPCLPHAITGKRLLAP